MPQQLVTDLYNKILDENIGSQRYQSLKEDFGENTRMLAYMAHQNLLPQFVTKLFVVCKQNDIPINYTGCHRHPAKGIFDESDMFANTFRNKHNRDGLMSGTIDRCDQLGEFLRVVDKNDVNFDVNGDVVDFDIQRFVDGEIGIVAINKSCTMCGERMILVYQFRDGQFFAHAVSHATTCYDAKPFTVELHYDAGDEILFGDWLGGYSIKEDYSLSDALIEFELDTRKYAKLNIGHLYVGNSCPSVYKKGNRLYIGRHPDVGVVDDEDCCEFIVHEGVERLGYVCTDLWAVTFATKRDIQNVTTKAAEHGIELDNDTGEQFGRSTFQYKTDKNITMKMSISPLRDFEKGECFAIIDIIER